MESVYEAALVYELIDAKMNVGAQVPLPVQYKDVYLEVGFRIGILAENQIVIEIKFIETLHDVYLFKTFKQKIRNVGKF